MYISYEKHYSNESYPTDYAGTEYYVSTDGSDSNNGLTPETAFATLTKASTLNTLSAGDAILLNSQDTFVGTLTVNNSVSSTYPITIAPYGNGDYNPTIIGSVPLTGWTQRGSSNIYVTKYSTADVTQLFVDGEKMVVARYPNTGYHYITTVVSTSQITMSAMASEASNYYVGAKVLVRPYAFYTDMRTVTASTGNTITMNSAVSGIETTEGIVLINKLEFLDSAGEWYYDTATDSLYLWTPAGDTPANYEVRGSTISDGIQVNGKNYVTIQDLNISQQKEKGINLGSVCTGIKILNNTISGAEIYGVEAEYTSTGGTRLEISGNTVSDCNAGGIYAYRADTSIIRDNIVEDIGLFDRLGILGTSIYDRGFGIYISGRGNSITYNRLDSIGYHGIYWNSYDDLGIPYYGASTISYNVVKNSGLLKSDCGGIYTGGRTTIGSLVSYNIVDNCYGTKVGSKDTRDFGSGIYLDEPSSTITAEYNTLINNSDGGISIHDGTSHTVRYNTMFNNRQGYIINDTVNSAASTITYNLSITDARIDTPMFDPRQLEVSYLNDYNMDSFDYNTYVNGYTSDLVFKIQVPFSYSAFAAWQTYTGGEANSTYIGTDLAVGEDQRVVYNDSKTAKTFLLNGATAKDENGTSITVGFTLQPFTSKYVRGTDLNNIE